MKITIITAKFENFIIKSLKKIFFKRPPKSLKFCHSWTDSQPHVLQTDDLILFFFFKASQKLLKYTRGEGEI